MINMQLPCICKGIYTHSYDYIAVLAQKNRDLVLQITGFARVSRNTWSIEYSIYTELWALC